jgi:peptidoglycan hydrolase-like protein with peptidoglycan-binding domain
LSNLGYYSGEIDGIDGFVTKSAVRSFQDYENFMAGTEVLKVDGIMGPKTKARLELRHGY